MNYGAWGKILRVNLSNKETLTQELPSSVYSKFLGGSGLGAYLLLRDFPRFNRYSPEHPLIFMAGLLTGLPVPTACKASLVSRSPLTSIYAESTAGGFWGRDLKAAGLDGIVITGESSEPVYLQIEDGKAEILPAENLWGLDTYRTAEALWSRHGREYRTACIGPAGEHRVPLASVMVEGRSARAFSRCGLGAVMGSKFLKAVLVKGSKIPGIYNREKLLEQARQDSRKLRECCRGLSRSSNVGLLSEAEKLGGLPEQNWQIRENLEGFGQKCRRELENKYYLRDYFCFACPIGCGKMLRLPWGEDAGMTARTPEYQALAGFGPNCGNFELKGIIAANDLCNRYGLDPVSTSAVIALAMEAYQKGMLSESECGRPLRWGNVGDILDLIEQITLRYGVGEVLGQGSRYAAKFWELEPEVSAPEVKGLELSCLDPRAFHSMALSYATANRGACDLEGMTYLIEAGILPGSLVKFRGEASRFCDTGKAELCVKMQNLGEIFNALGLCKILLQGHFAANEILGWLNPALGWDMSENDLMKIGERLYTLKRAYNNAQGISRKDDKLPERILNPGVAERPGPNLETLLGDYYHLRGWDEFGFPQPQKMQELDIADLF